MNKQEFFEKLRKELTGLPKQDVEERLAFYNEIVEDQIEEGITEQDAIKSIGTVSQIAKQIITDTPLSKIAKERIKPKRHLSAWEIVLLVLGSPVWLSLLITAIAIIFSIYISLCSVIISLWAVFISLIACALGGIAGGIIIAFTQTNLTWLAVIACALLCGGISIFMFYICKLSSKGILIITKRIALFIKKCFIKKERA